MNDTHKVPDKEPEAEEGAGGDESMKRINEIIGKAELYVDTLTEIAAYSWAFVEAHCPLDLQHLYKDNVVRLIESYNSEKSDNVAQREKREVDTKKYMCSVCKYETDYYPPEGGCPACYDNLGGTMREEAGEED